jgi:Domain of unknown function (DUF1911)/Domain of unknown function (DUF1910)
VTRDNRRQQAWFDEWVAYDQTQIERVREILQTPAVDSSHEPQYVYQQAQRYLHLLLRRYSRGDAIDELKPYIAPLLDTWEQAEELGKAVWTESQQYTRHAWKVNLDHYINCFWLVGLGLSLEIGEDHWRRLLALIGNEGEDRLLDRIIASRQTARRIGDTLCHPKPYARLQAAIDAPQAQQAALLADFVQHWYAELDRAPLPGREEATRMYTRPSWYRFHEFEGAYFGYWCIEAVAAVKAFGIDDTPCLGMPNYPGDLLRPAGPSNDSPVSKPPAAPPAEPAGRGTLLRKLSRGWSGR